MTSDLHELIAHEERPAPSDALDGLAVRAARLKDTVREQGSRALEMFQTAPHGPALTIARQEFHLKRMSAGMTRDIRKWLASANDEGSDAPRSIMLDGSVGRMMFEGAMQTDTLDRLEGFLRRFLYEPLPEGIAEQADPEELIAAVDAFFAQSGFTWLDQITKNSAALAVAQQDQAIQAAITRQILDADDWGFFHGERPTVFDYIVLTVAGQPTQTDAYRAVNVCTLPELLALYCFTRQWDGEQRARQIETTRLMVAGVAQAFGGGEPYSAFMGQLAEMAQHYRRSENAEQPAQTVPAEHMSFYRPKAD